ncbi:MAG: hypothetical protein ABWZ66_06100 [Pyrinomonadaceae bacterium]
MKDTVQWTTPSPLWQTAISQTSAVLRRAEFSRPSILRFATDTFMDDYVEMLANDPKRLAQYVALPETWRGVAPQPEPIKIAPAFARKLNRLRLISKRKEDKKNGVNLLPAQFAAFSNNSANKPLKLYQPAHQRFYLISACLVCERPGLPDKALNGDREEKVSYVIRRLFPKGALNPDEPLPALDSTWEEYAFVVKSKEGRWQKVANKNSVVDGEERQPLFAVSFDEDDGRRRKIFSGVIPAARRESYIAAGSASTSGAGGSTENDAPDSRTLLMRAQFRDPWKSLLQSAQHTKNAIQAGEDADDDQPEAVKADLLNGVRDQIQTMSWLALLDFADFLINEMPRIWAALNNNPVSPALSDEEAELKDVITNTALNSAFNTDVELGVAGKFLKGTAYTKTQVKRTLKEALVAVKGTNPSTGKPFGDDLEAVTISYSRTSPETLYPNFLFPLADPEFNLQTKLDGATVQITRTIFEPENFAGEDAVNRIAQKIEAAFPAKSQDLPPQPTPLVAQTPMDMREGWFVIRCVYERPLCGDIDPPVLSEPTKPFQIAGFFDPDAPARPIRISLPIDPTPAGLRKFDRNTAFMMSDLLCGQVNRFKGITFGDLVLSVLPFPFHKGLSIKDKGGCKKSGNISIGMMCSLSIPIITICALILLMIIVSLLDFIFRWLPLFIMCFPLPGLKSKK